MVINETKIDVETVIEVNYQWGIISTFKVNKSKNNEERKMEGILRMLRRNEK